MTSARVEPELHALRKLAEQFALRQRETLTSAHLLAAISARPSAAAVLLDDRRLTTESLLRLAKGSGDELEQAVPLLLQRAHAVAVRMGATRGSAEHVLVAILNEPRCAARRLLEDFGTDVSRLRSSALQVGLGLIARRVPAAKGAQLAEIAPAPPEPPAPRRPSTAVSVPFVPQKKHVVVEAVPSPPAPAAPAPLLEAKPLAANLERFELDTQKFPTLVALGKNLTLAAAKGELDPVVGRDEEIEQALDVLAKREGNCPILVGVAGVGKTSVVRGLAQRIAEQQGTLSLDDKLIIQIPIAELVAGTGVRGALASRLGSIRREVMLAKGRVVLFFDEMHQLFVGEAAEEIAGELKLAFARGELPTIGATTFEEYQKAIGNDAALARRFTLVEVPEPTREDAYLVLEALRSRLEGHHRVGYQQEALALCVAWTVRYLPGRALPDKAVSALDLAGARTRRRGRREVTAEAVAEVVAELADMPIERLLESDGDRMLRLEEILAERVVGHGPQIRRVARILRRNAAGLGSRRPIGTFLLLGPTGVGKTETAKAIAEVLFHCESAMTRLDLSEFSEAHAVARLIGAPPGYVGHEAGGALTEAVRRRPYQVILLDELEKAHPDVLTSFLAVFDEGRMTDGRGRTVDFTNTVILMTSNIGAAETGAAPKRRVGFGGSDDRVRADLEERVTAAARAALAPELYNRIDEVLVFTALDRSEVREIARRSLGGVARMLKAQRGVELEFGDDVVEYLLDHGGYDPTLGARPMKRTIARLVEAPLAERILRGELGRGSVALLAVEGDELDLDVIDAKSGAAAE
jgi:ATP-dependent Clp protease ATP-binding subunit ClpC